ncbi:plancitoxin-1-like [Dermacentor variabilis]|uniref:plancitoxin-1-like n=1 Tax=Dermacentor variabilis TaxID=34621 RepID=UPI003F5BD6CC
MATFDILAQLVFIGTCVSFYGAFVNAKVSCKNAKGKDVDWFVVYKIPKTKPNAESFMQPNGGEMAYYDSKSKNSRWTLLQSDIGVKKDNPIAETLAPIYQKTSNVAYLAYNDQLPHKFNGTRQGHSKGVLLAGKGLDMGAVWLQHSVPRFVDDVNNGYEYPANGRENGQLFLCITFPLGTVEKISYHLQVQGANVYQTRYLPWTDAFPTFSGLLKRNYMRKFHDLQVDILLTRKKRPVLAIAKSPKWNKDIYTQELSDKVGDSITVQSWKNGAGGAQDMYCAHKRSVTDVQVVKVQTQFGSLIFSSREDHSKWSVTSNKGVFCFSSLNRMVSQWKRGGEITCIGDTPLAKLFRNSIYKRSSCKKER